MFRVVLFLVAFFFCNSKEKSNSLLNYNVNAKEYIADCFVLKGHIQAGYIHEFTWKIHEANGNSESKIKKIVKFSFDGIKSFYFGCLSIKNSIFGAILIQDYRYLHKKFGYTTEKLENQKKIKILNYNVGFLPGKLAQELTVGKFNISSNERCNKICDFLLCELQTHDLILLEEAFDPLFIDTIVDKLKKSNHRCHLYYHIGDPLKPGLSSGLAVISKFEISNLEVKILDNNEPFIQRCFLVIPASNYIVIHTHLSASTDKIRIQQLLKLMSHIDEKQNGYLIGDLNFSDKIKSFDFIPKKSISSHINTTTLLYPSKVESHPDFIGSFGNNSKKPKKIKVLSKIRLSDHFPISVEVTS